MKKITLLMFGLIIMVVFMGCGEPNSNNSSDVLYKPHQNLTYAEISYQTNWLNKDLSKVGLNDISVDKVLKGCFSIGELNFTSSAYLLCDYLRYGENSILRDSYLAVETDSKVLFKDLSDENYCGSYADEVYVCDTDGDGYDEIVVQQAVGMTGGAGQYYSRVFKVVENEIKEIFNSSPVNKFNTGFISNSENNFKLTIKNTFTEYSSTLDFKEKDVYIGVYYKGNGESIGDPQIMCDSFRGFVPIDIESDGVFEISCMQYVSLYGHSDYIGDAESIIKFNAEKQKFEVIKAEFVPIETQEWF